MIFNTLAHVETKAESSRPLEPALNLWGSRSLGQNFAFRLGLRALWGLGGNGNLWRSIRTTQWHVVWSLKLCATERLYCRRMVSLRNQNVIIHLGNTSASEERSPFSCSVPGGVGNTYVPMIRSCPLTTATTKLSSANVCVRVHVCIYTYI